MARRLPPVGTVRMDTSPRPPKYLLLEPLRGLAALWVFMFHFSPSQAWREAYPILEPIARVGHLGVPMFFVISGYCITGAARATILQRRSTRHYLYRRLRRIYPPYWFSIGAVAALPFVLEALSALKTGHYQPPSADNLNYGFMRYSLVDWAFVASLAQVFRDIPGATTLDFKFTTINAVYWTLAIEVQFYVAVGLALVYRSRFYWSLFAVTLLSLPLVFSVRASLTGVFLPYWPQFACGAVVFLLFERGLAPSRLLGPRAPWFSVVVAALAIGSFLGWMALGLPIGHLGFAAFVSVVVFSTEGLDRSFASAVDGAAGKTIRAVAGLAALLGAMSYTIYLLHGRVQFLGETFARQVFPQNSVAHDLLTIGITLTVCYVFYLICERPFATGQTLPARPRPRLSAAPEGGAAP